MCTFNGFIDEIPFISVDCFLTDNLTSSLFFLSHCHADHMRGLFENASKLKGPLYTSEISAIFVKKQYPDIPDVQVLEVNSPINLIGPDGSDLVITTFSAQHCPGSVMFLFETKETNVLYTGDFRLSKSDFPKLSILQDKKITTAYLDTTFVNPIFAHFPSQLESINTVLRLSEEWLDKDNSHKIIVECAAQYGSEYLFMELGRKLKCKLYIKPNQWQKYIYIPALAKYMSDDENECRIYICLKNEKNWILRWKQQFSFRIIKPSALFWRNWKPNESFIREETSQIYRVALSHHCSLSELKDFVDFLKPKIIKPIVIPDDSREFNKIIRSWMAYNEDACTTTGENDGGSENERYSKPSSSFQFNSIYGIIDANNSREGEDSLAVKEYQSLLPKRIKM